MPVDLYREFDHNGLDSLSSVSKRKPGYFEDCLNVISSLSGSILKRPGYKPVADSIGGEGLFTYVHPDTGTEEILTLSGGSLYRATPTTFTITYSGTGEATVSLIYDDDQAEYVLFLYVDGDEVLNSDLGLGIDNEFGTTLSDLKDDIDALTDFSATIDGNDDLAAAFLFPLSLEASIDGTRSFTAFDWVAVYQSLTSPLISHWNSRNDDDYQRVTNVDIVGNKYIGCGQVPIMKYDGQNFYLAGMMEPMRPTIVETGATGEAEVTEVTCVADATITEISTIEAHDTTGVANNSWALNNNGTYFVIYDDVGSVGVYAQLIANADLPPAGVDRTIKFVYHTGDSDSTVANLIKTVVDADSKFSATRSGAIITITNSSAGARTDISIGTGSSVSFINPTVIQQGISSLDGKFFKIWDASGSVAVWTRTSGGTPEPLHGCDRAIPVTISPADSAPTVANAIKVAVDADAAFDAAVSGNVITITDAADGARTDATSETSGFGIVVTTQGANGGLGNNEFIYHITYEQKDHQNIITEGMPSDDVSITDSNSSKWNNVTIANIQPDSGYNTGCAVVSGNQSNVNTITVNTGHTLHVGDAAFFKGQSQAALAEVTSIVCTTAAGLDGKYFYLFGNEGGAEALVAFWIDVDDNGTTEPAHGAPISVEITTITTGMSATQVGAEVASAVNARAEWNAMAASGTVTVTDAYKESRSDGSAGNSGFTVTVTTQGTGNRPAGNVTRLVTAIASTTITIDGDPVTVADDQPISNNLKINIWRTEADGVAISKFLVDTVPNNSLTASTLYTDKIPDSELGRLWIAPRKDHGVPPTVRYLSAWNAVLVGGGNSNNPSTAYYSIPGETSPEYFPADDDQILLNSPHADAIRGMYPVGDKFSIFKDKSLYQFSGDIYQDNVRVDQMFKNDIKFFSAHSFTDIDENILYLDQHGVFALAPTGFPKELSTIIHPSFDLGESASFLRGQAAILRQLHHIYYFIPVEAISTNGDRYATQESPVFVYHMKNGGWYIWDNFNMAGGLIRLGDDYFFQEERWDEVTQSMRYHLYRIHNEHTIYDYADINEPISASFRTVRYGADNPEIYKKLVRIRVQHDPALIGDNEEIDCTTHLGLTSTAPHSSFSLLPDTVGRSKQRLLPTKSTAIALTFSNNEVHQNMAMIGWSIEGGMLDNASHMKE